MIFFIHSRPTVAPLVSFYQPSNGIGHDNCYAVVIVCGLQVFWLEYQGLCEETRH